MQNFIKFLVAVLIVVGICWGIYQFMPPIGHNFIEYQIQMATNKDAKTAITGIQNATLKDYPEYTYKDVLESRCQNSSWVYAPAATEGGYTVTYIGNKAAFVITDGSDDQKISTESVVKVVFKVSSNGAFSYDMYVDGVFLDKSQKKKYTDLMAAHYRDHINNVGQ